MIAWNNVQLLAEVQLTKKFGIPNLGQTGQNQAQNQVFHHFLKFGLLVFLEILQDESSEQCLTTSRGTTHKNGGGVKLGQTGQNWAQIWSKMIFLVLMLLVVHSNLLVIFVFSNNLCCMQQPTVIIIHNNFLDNNFFHVQI